MFLRQYLYLRERLPLWKGKLFRWLFSGEQLLIEEGFKCDTWPSVNITDGAKVYIGPNTHLRRNVEIRAHGQSTVRLEGDIRIDRGVRILAANAAEIIIENGTRIGLYSVLNGGDSIRIGAKVLISGFVYLQTSMHNHQREGKIQNQGYSHAPVKLEEDAWLGAHVVVLPGVTIGQGGVVGSNAVVTKDVAAFEVVGGVPAKVLKIRS
ncbi:MAG: acyltransferase [Saprospiraceae bacterium]|nr:acyltransferase [Saprospiraceae bacterium]